MKTSEYKMNETIFLHGGLDTFIKTTRSLAWRPPMMLFI